MKIAFVTPWYGPEIPGGMEAETWRTVTRLRRAGHDVEVLTTCIRDFFADWSKNYHKPGTAVVDGVPVRRFKVQKRERAAFDAVNRQLMQGKRISAAEERVYVTELFRCPDMYSYLRARQDDYAVFFFIPYMFPTTFFGAQMCPRRSVVIPCLHDEGYARLQIFREVLPRVHTLILHTQAERELVAALYGPAPAQTQIVVGTGVDAEFTADAGRFRRKYGLNEPFMVYVGRRDAGKNTPLLLSYWQRYAQETRTPAKLALIGPGQLRLPPALQGQVVDLGFVPPQDKYDAIAAATALCQPSVNESFSLVIMEAWLTETAVLVHGACGPTREHVQRCHGGLYFENYDEFAATTHYLFSNPGVTRRMGANGRGYVLRNYTWDKIVEAYAGVMERVARREERGARGEGWMSDE